MEFVGIFDFRYDWNMETRNLIYKYISIRIGVLSAFDGTDSNVNIIFIRLYWSICLFACMSISMKSFCRVTALSITRVEGHIR